MKIEVSLSLLGEILDCLPNNQVKEDLSFVMQTTFFDRWNELHKSRRAEAEAKAAESAKTTSDNGLNF